MATMRSMSVRPVAGVSFAGQTYEPDEEGIFEVPDEAVAELRHHGLEPAVRAAVQPVENPVERVEAEWAKAVARGKAEAKEAKARARAAAKQDPNDE